MITTSSIPHTYTTFDGHRRIATGALLANALAAKQALDRPSAGPVLIFDDLTGRNIDVDMRGTPEALAARFAALTPAPILPEDTPDEADSAASLPGTRGRGRPKLGVVAREVTLLPRHWDWLAGQPGGASVALRKLVEQARRNNAEQDARRQAHERAYHFMQAIGGDLPGFEQATRALFADDAAQLDAALAAWPQDVRDHAMRLACGDAPAPQR